MAASIVTLDTIEDASAWQDRSGWHGTQRAIVKGLDDLTGLERRIAAATVDGIPVVGVDTMPVPSPFVSICSSVRAVPLSKTAAEVFIAYEPPGDTILEDEPPSETSKPRFSVRTSLQPVSSNTDENGNLIILQHENLIYKEDILKFLPAVLAGPREVSHAAGTRIKQVGEIQKYIPVVVFVFERREPSSPRHKSQQYIGKVHFRSIFGDPFRSWMCTRLDGLPNNDGLSYLTTYEFTRAVEDKGIDGRPTSGWDPIVSVYDHERNTFFDNPVKFIPGRPLPTDGIIGQRQIRDAETADFTLLNLHFDDV